MALVGHIVDVAVLTGCMAYENNSSMTVAHDSTSQSYASSPELASVDFPTVGIGLFG